MKSAIYILLVTSYLLTHIFADQKVIEAKPGNPERRPIMEAMRGPVSEYAKTGVIFTGDVDISGSWAKFTGHTNAKNGKPFAEEIAGELELDFLAILQKENGKWILKYYGWSGDIGTMIEARKRFPKLPELLVPKIPD